MKRTIQLRSGFTLIELLVVITIIGILATLAPSAITNVINAANQTKALSNARNIGMALKTYATDNDGAFPSGETAAAAFSKLLPKEAGASGYGVNKKQFFVKGSAYSPSSKQQESGDQKTISEGENHWAMMGGLDDAGSGRWPLVFDGPASAEGKYSGKKSEKGGVWEGKTAILVRLDGSAGKEKLNESFTIQSDGQDNALKPGDSWATGGKVLMP